MANTLKFGNGEWYGKKDTILAYNDLNSNYKPLPFNFSRASKATVVNKDGLIEEVGSGQPRVDYLNNTKGALKLEPQRTNYQPYSTDFSVWGLSGATVNINYGLSPDGLNNSTLITEGTGSAQHRIVKGSPASSGIYTLSCFVKNKVGNHQAYIDMGAVTGFFSFDTKTMFSATGTTSVEIWSDDWYRISITSSSNITPIVTFLGIGKNNNETFQGDGSSAIEFFAPQLEQGSYPTSAIFTSGSAVTRLADNTKIVNSPILQATNQFTLFFDAKDFVNYGATFANIMITLGAGESPYDAGSGVHIYNKIWYYFNGSSAVTLGNCYNAITDSKFAISYDGTKYTRYANGVKLGTNTVSASMSNWDTITNGSLSYSGVDRVFDIADLKLYDTALSDSELAALTQV
jgi:hypothetical protein